MDDTSNEFTIYKDDVEEKAATAVTSGWSTSGRLFIGNATNDNNPLDTHFYGMIIYEGSATNQDAYNWLLTRIGL